MFKSSNPTLQTSAFSKVRSYGEGGAMTVQGTMNKTMILLGILLVAAWWIWTKVMTPVGATVGYDQMALTAQQNQQNVLPFIFGGGILGFIVAMVTIFKKEWAMYTAPVYAVCEGLVLGGISVFFEMMYPGIVMQAVGLTFGTLLSMLMLYKSGIIKVTEKFRMGVVAATGGICLVYFLSWIFSFFGAGFSFIHNSSLFSIGFSFFVVGIAALNLVLDFDLIERGAEQGVPKYMEWYGAFGLMVTLVWLYLEILKLLVKLRGRD